MKSFKKWLLKHIIVSAVYVIVMLASEKANAQTPLTEGYHWVDSNGVLIQINDNYQILPESAEKLSAVTNDPDVYWYWDFTTASQEAHNYTYFNFRTNECISYTSEEDVFNTDGTISSEYKSRVTSIPEGMTRPETKYSNPDDLTGTGHLSILTSLYNNILAASPVVTVTFENTDTGETYSEELKYYNNYCSIVKFDAGHYKVASVTMTGYDGDYKVNYPENTYTVGNNSAQSVAIIIAPSDVYDELMAALEKQAEEAVSESDEESTEQITEPTTETSSSIEEQTNDNGLSDEDLAEISEIADELKEEDSETHTSPLIYVGAGCLVMILLGLFIFIKKR